MLIHEVCDPRDNRLISHRSKLRTSTTLLKLVITLDTELLKEAKSFRFYCNITGKNIFEYGNYFDSCRSLT